MAEIGDDQARDFQQHRDTSGDLSHNVVAYIVWPIICASAICYCCCHFCSWRVHVRARGLNQPIPETEDVGNAVMVEMPDGGTAIGRVRSDVTREELQLIAQSQRGQRDGGRGGRGGEPGPASAGRERTGTQRMTDARQGSGDVVEGQPGELSAPEVPVVTGQPGASGVLGRRASPRVESPRGHHTVQPARLRSAQLSSSRDQRQGQLPRSGSAPAAFSVE
jgi:hypothetical protein